MAKYQVVNDIHLSDRAPAMCTESYTDDLFNLLEQTVEVEKEENCQGTIWAGDIFHIKAPNRNSHALVQRTQDIAAKYRNLWIVPGNHDMSADRLDSIMETQPLGVLFRSGAKLLSGWEETGEHPIYGVPWLQRFTPETVEEAFSSWDHEENVWNREQSLVITHAPLYPPGQELEWEHYPTQGDTGWSAAMGNRGYVVYGHVHDAHGIYKVGGVTYANPGALSRGSLTEASIKRRISTTIWDASSGFTFHELNYRPADEIFRMADKEASVTKQLELDDFLARIGEARIEITTTGSVMEHVRSLNLGTRLEKLIQELLEGAE